jgi:serine/threonine protein kinase
MAPEYILHRAVSERSDVFSAGVILFEMLLGRRAFVGDSLNAVMQRIAEQDIVVPEDAGIDERLCTILLKATARDPALRFQTASQFAEALDNYLTPSRI